MLVEIENIEEDARVLIFPAERKLYPQEVEEVKSSLASFLTQFPLESSFQIFFDRFIVIMISSEKPFDLAMNDELIEIIQNFEKKFNLSLIDKVKVFFKQDEYIQCKEVPEFKKLIKSKSVSKSTIVFNHFVHTKREFEEAWESTAEESWISHFF
jgi:hypothetical protein